MFRRLLVLSVFLAITLAVIGCGDSGSSSGPDPSTTSDSGGTGDTNTAGTWDDCPASLGGSTDPIWAQATSRMTLTTQPQFPYHMFSGAVVDRAPVEFHGEAESEGLCRLLTYQPAPCVPNCAPPTVCVKGTCQPAPTTLDSGSATLTGLGDAPIALSFTADYGYFWDLEADLGLAEITLTTTGADVAAFALSVCGTTPAEPTADWNALMAARQDGEDVTLEWSNPIDSARIYLRMTTGIGTHGGISPVEIECEGPDLGSLTLPGSYLDALYADGWSCGECGGNDLMRYQAAETTVDGHSVQLRVQGRTSFWHIPGVTR